MTDFQREREALGAWLSQLRQDAGLNGQQLAERLRWPASKVSRIQNGRQTPTESDVVEWANAVGAPESVEDLRARVTTLEEHYKTWRRQLRGGHAARQRASVSLERDTRMLRAFEPGVVPGLLQTAEYARHLFERLVDLRETPNDVSDAVGVRMQRQSVLYDPSKSFHFVVTMGALRARVAPASAMRGQLDRLVMATTLDNVRLGVIPDDAEMPLPANHGFWIFDERLVLVETWAAELQLADPSELDLYGRVFERYAAHAVYGRDCRTALTSLAVELGEID